MSVCLSIIDCSAARFDAANVFFASSRIASKDFTAASNTLKILKDNGAPMSDNQLVLNTTAGASFLGKQVNSSVRFTDDIMTSGILGSNTGLNLRESAQILTSKIGRAHV